MAFVQRNEIQGTVIYQSELLTRFSNVVHGITTRHGGTSPAPFASLNLSTHVGDDAANVEENIERVRRALELPRGAIVDARQAQADRVARVTRAERGTRLSGVDGLITNEPGIPLLLRFADCAPILLYDPARRAIGVAHAGWRGAVAKVLTNTVNAMRDAFGTAPRELIACIGPSIGPCCYEIGADVQERARRAFPDAPAVLVQNKGAVHLDLWHANAAQLRALGVEQIQVAGICTADHTHDFYSWRRENARTGRFAALIALT